MIIIEKAALINEQILMYNIRLMSPNKLSRRNFLRLGVLAAAGLLVGGCLPDTGNSRSKSEIIATGPETPFELSNRFSLTQISDKVGVLAPRIESVPAGITRGSGENSLISLSVTGFEATDSGYTGYAVKIGPKSETLTQVTLTITRQIPGQVAQVQESLTITPQQLNQISRAQVDTGGIATFLVLPKQAEDGEWNLLTSDGTRLINVAFYNLPDALNERNKPIQGLTVQAENGTLTEELRVNLFGGDPHESNPVSP